MERGFEKIKSDAELQQEIRENLITQTAADIAREIVEKRWGGRPTRETLQSAHDAAIAEETEKIRAELEAVYDKFGDMIPSAPNPEEALEKLYFKEKEESEEKAA